MNKYELVKNFYKKNLWNLDRVKNAVIKSWITAEEFEKITGIIYSQD